MDEEELQKRNTDCVYFLASPLTCKKGIECEYRHSEIARLNPRDCCYWLAGSCFNPSCAFRHPPLDTHTEVSSKSAPPQSQCSAPTNKVNAPCYFYFNGFCNKGDRCSFLHGPNEDGTPAWKSSEVTGALPLENKASARSDAGSAPIETFPIPSEAAPKREAEIQSTLKEDVQSALNNVKDQSASPHLSTSDCEETSVRSDTLLLEKGLIQSRSLVCTDQSSEEQVDGPIEREDWLESSPGFDVLVGDISEVRHLWCQNALRRVLKARSTYECFNTPEARDSLFPFAAMLETEKELISHVEYTHTEVSSKSAPPQSQCSAPTNKVNAPCYFYFNGFCNKGDRCSFLHGPNEDGTPAWKSSEVTGALPLENKASARSDAGSAPIETFPIPSEAAPKREAEIQSTLKEDVQSALNNVKDQSASPHLSTSDCEETSVRSDTLLLEKGLIQSRSLVCTDQSSEEQVDGPIEREDWLESSPGFDVLVGDISEVLSGDNTETSGTEEAMSQCPKFESENHGSSSGSSSEKGTKSSSKSGSGDGDASSSSESHSSDDNGAEEDSVPESPPRKRTKRASQA
ncbi:hypothetical protein TEA_018241 [Camellia sinensis var. sinensis]|uniref:C3H1-type domain-containing protein n=1 Tax=Camellia sinensis var. sinensis TaxID=542762 RepID=A0A4S4DDU6_CAMSN|nr:hypothetical protein TEA_018241 [Camellia sinensis var. sinensis]